MATTGSAKPCVIPAYANTHMQRDCLTGAESANKSRQDLETKRGSNAGEARGSVFSPSLSAYAYLRMQG